MEPGENREPQGPSPRSMRGRLALYYRHNERLLGEGRQEIAPQDLAADLGLDEQIVAADMKRLGIEPGPSGALATQQIKAVAEHQLGLRPVNTAVLVGMGRLGAAIASYEGFGAHGMRIMAVFDDDPAKIGRFQGGHKVLPLEQLEDVINIFEIRLAVLTVPAEAAQAIATRLARAGVAAIWNFAPVRLDLPEGVVVRNEHITAGLAQLCSDLREANLRRLPPEED
ncbi:MAG: redox-sensing transcriptional repressor Rex [Candidatus Eisenbacteria bacterium]|nr:redox-sensing transcriptional repressor Rex [Candidatus Eisenbacteria bacterium]